MKLSTIDDNIRSLGLGQGNDFKINASAKAFDILSSNIYQNKILAVIREITCNAVDAHKMVGKDASTIEVHIPNHISPFFSVRDFGPGLSHDNVMSLYTTYFLSTKDTSDDFIGGLGLGSKSPFAVADQFTVVSRYEGVCSTYIMYRDAGQPKINVISQVPDDEPSGLLVSVAVNKDYGAWATEARNFFWWWRVRPKTGLTFTNIDEAMGLKATDTFDGFPVWFFIKPQNSINGPSVLMGGVRYAVTLSNVLGLKTQMNASTPLVMVFPIGAVDISTSRETLSYTPKTCAAIIQRLTEITNNFRSVIQTNIDGCATLYAARDLLWNSSENLSGLFQQMGGNTSSILWKGKTIHQSLRLGWDELTAAVPGIAFRIYTQKGWKDRKYQLYSNSENIPITHRGYIIKDHGIGRYRNIWQAFWLPAIDRKLEYKFKYNLQHHMAINDAALLLIGPDFKIISDYLEGLGFPPIVDASGWPDIPPALRTAATKRSPPTKGYVINPTNLTYEATEKDVDLKGGGVYIPFFGGDPDYSLNDLRLLTQLGHKFPSIIGLRRLGITQKLQAELDKNGWIPNNDKLISRVISDTTITHNYEKQAIFNAANNKFPVQPFFAVLSKYQGTASLPAILTTLQSRAYDFNSMQLAHTSSNVFTRLSEAQQKVAAAATASGAKLAADLLAFLSTKPLVWHLNYNSEVSPLALVNYINS